LYSSPDIIMMIKSRRIIWTWHLACIGKVREAFTLFVGKPELEDH